VKRRTRLRTALGLFYEANDRLLHWHTVVLLSGMMIVIWLVMVGTNYLLLEAAVRGQTGPPVTLPHLTALMAVMAASIFVSPTPGGIGVSEGASVLFPKQLGYTQNFMPFRLLSRAAFYLAVCLLFAAGQGPCEPLPVIPGGEDRLRKQGALEGQP